MKMSVLPITAKIAELSQSDSFSHGGDSADRLIATTALANRTQLITADEKLRSTQELRCFCKHPQIGLLA